MLDPEENIFKGWEKSVNKIWEIPIFKILQKRKGSMKQRRKQLPLTVSEIIGESK